jgi:type IV secretory pathway VirB4 component
MFKNHKKKSKQSKQSNKIDDVDDNETEVQSKDIDFVEIATNVYINKKTNQLYEIAPDDDLNEDEDLF